MKSKEYLSALNLIPHPEGGYYREIYRNRMQLKLPDYEGNRSIGTSIYFLLEKGQVSSLHRIKSDEIWYYHDGGTIEIVEMDECGNEVITLLGKNISNGEKLQHVVSANTWFGARLTKESEFCLVGCQVSPGFDFRDFELKNNTNKTNKAP